MELKNYQKRVVDEVGAYLRAVAAEQEKGNAKHGASDAWEQVTGRCGYSERRTGDGKDLPHFTIRVPTGGGKTLIATQALGDAQRTILRNRNGAGLALWVVPSSQIYRDTLRNLRDREHMYRLMLEHAVGRRIEVWEKHEIARLTPARLRDALNILVVQLASTNRETADQLKFFKDSGGPIVQHFPPENDLEAHRKLREEIPNLETIPGTDLLMTSVGNLVRLQRPAVILDEGHKATSDLARKTIERFNPSVVIELSATPQAGANILSVVSGRELLDEEMIKLPINIATSGAKNWKDVLTQARDRRIALAKQAAKHAETAGPDRRIRPIVLVQVERTGKDQREKGVVHAEDAREYLMQQLDVPKEAIRVKSAAEDGLENENLLDPDNPVEWIITKSALQEGWDCPFAYILVSLNNTGSATAMAQLVGRVLRQPFQQRTPFPELNESYVYCLRTKAATLTAEVKKALEKEGYEDAAGGIVRDTSGNATPPRDRTISIRGEFRDLYTKPFKGKIYLPRFCVCDGDEFRPLDYFIHLIDRVDVDRFEYAKIDWPLVDVMKDARNRFYRYELGSDGLEQEHDTAADLVESDEQVMGWLVASLGVKRFEFLSHKQLKRIVVSVCKRLIAAELQLKDNLALVKFEVRQRLERWVQEQIDLQTKAAFDELFDQGRILFYLHCADCRFEVPPTFRVELKGQPRPLVRENGDPIAKSLFDYVETESQNEYETAVALCLDRDENILWWFRNRIGREHFSIQGYKRGNIYPDFVAQGTHEGRTENRVFVVESKGKHLEGNPDTEYKRNIADYFQRAGRKVSWQQLGEDFKDHIFRFQILDEAQPDGREWRDELSALLTS